MLQAPAVFNMRTNPPFCCSHGFSCLYDIHCGFVRMSRTLFDIIVDKLCVECIFVCCGDLNGNNGSWTNSDDVEDDEESVLDSFLKHVANDYGETIRTAVRSRHLERSREIANLVSNGRVHPDDLPAMEQDRVAELQAMIQNIQNSEQVKKAVHHDSTTKSRKKNKKNKNKKTNRIEHTIDIKQDRVDKNIDVDIIAETAGTGCRELVCSAGGGEGLVCEFDTADANGVGGEGGVGGGGDDGAEPSGADDPGPVPPPGDDDSEEGCFFHEQSGSAPRATVCIPSVVVFAPGENRWGKRWREVCAPLNEFIEGQWEWWTGCDVPRPRPVTEYDAITHGITYRSVTHAEQSMGVPYGWLSAIGFNSSYVGEVYPGLFDFLYERCTPATISESFQRTLSQRVREKFFALYEDCGAPDDRVLCNTMVYISARVYTSREALRRHLPVKSTSLASATLG